ncbi:hypothetical protein FOVSG1_006556 [Fusarium oxysporum f. sp. vasinfectum]
MAKEPKSPTNDMQLDAEDLRVGEMTEDAQHDAVFGEITEDGPNYRNVGWVGTAFLMMKTQIGLGVLSFPSVFDTLGMIPGVILLCTVAGITTWSNYIVGVFKLKHRNVYGVDDAGQLMFGRIGKELFAFAFLGQYVMTAGSAMLSLSISLNALSNHGACTAIFVAVAFILIFVLSSIRTLGRITWLAIVGVFCIITAVLTVTIAVGTQDQPPTAPQDAEWKSDYKLFGNPTFAQAVSAVTTLIFAYAGTGAFFPIVSEMKDPHLYPRALAVCQTTVTIIFLVVGIVVYYYCGSYVASPALGSAGSTIKKVSYGIAFPGLLVSGIILAHVSSKYLFVRILRGSKHLTSNSLIHWATWLGCSFGVCLIAYILASAIPVFNGIVSLSGALFGTLLSFQPMGCMWLYDNWSRGKENPTVRWRMMVGWSCFVIASGTFMMVAGTYGAICDQARPGCITCRANGVECDGYQQPRLQWVNGSEEVSTGSDNPITRFPNFPYSSEEAQVSSSAELVSSLSHTSLDGSLADVDYMSKQCPETRDGVFVGPFGAFSAQAQTPTPSIHGSPGSPIQDDIVMSHPVPELDEPDTTHQHRSQELEPSPDLDCWPNSDNFLDWQDVFDLDSSTILPASLDLDSIQALPTPLDGTPSFQNAPEDVWLAENQQTYQDPSQPPALSGLLSPTEAQLLLGHYSSNVIAHIWSFPLGRKSSMDIHFDTAVSTLARLTLVARTPVSHASLSHLYAVLAISSKHMGDNVQRETREYWSDLAERLYSVSWDNFRHSLKHETSPKVAKYKDLVMAISSLNSFSVS